MLAEIHKQVDKIKQLEPDAAQFINDEEKQQTNKSKILEILSHISSPLHLILYYAVAYKKQGALIINHSGIIRFRIKNEIKKDKLYRNFEVDYSEFLNDLEEQNNRVENYDKKSLLNMVKIFFQKINYPIDYNELAKLNMDQLVNTVSMISPFSVEEKQKLIETVKIDDKIKVLGEIINFNLVDFEENKTVQ